MKTSAMLGQMRPSPLTSPFLYFSFYARKRFHFNLTISPYYIASVLLSISYWDIFNDALDLRFLSLLTDQARVKYKIIVSLTRET